MTKLFGTDGVRGVAGVWPLTPEFVRRLGAGAAAVLARHERNRTRRVLVVRDTRASGPMLGRALAEGLTAGGFRVVDAGVLPTAACAVVMARRPFAAGVVVSASHNPAPDNGLKFFGPRGEKLPESWEKEIEQEAQSVELPPLGGRMVQGRFAHKDYVSFLKSTLPRGKSLKGLSLVLDAGHGAASGVAEEVCRSLGAQVTVLHDAPNGKNINHRSGALHPERLARVVKARRAQIGRAHV